MYKVRFMLLLTMVMLLGVSWAQVPEKPGAQPFKVAFIGDTGYDPHDTPALDSNFEQVLDRVRSEGAHLLAIAGDFSYEEERNVARVYFSNINRILGEHFPVRVPTGITTNGLIISRSFKRGWSGWG